MLDVGIVYISFREASSSSFSSSWCKCLGNTHTTVPSVVDGGRLQQSGYLAIQFGAPDVSTVHVAEYTMEKNTSCAINATRWAWVDAKHLVVPPERSKEGTLFVPLLGI